MASSSGKPKNYFLNESHELSPTQETGGGRQVKYLNISWPQKAQRLHSSLDQVARRAAKSEDPLGRKQYYLVTDPSVEIVKASSAKDAKGGEKHEAVSFSGEQSKLFERVGLDLIEVHPNGAATVHATVERMEQLLAKTSNLHNLGRVEQARFVAFDSFGWLPGKWKFDEEWLTEIGAKPSEGYIQLQPLISDLDADLVIRSLEKAVRMHAGFSLRGKGKSYLGRFFLRANMDAATVRRLAETYTSIQSIHPPVKAFAGNLIPEIGNAHGRAVTIQAIQRNSLPTVAVVDTAVPLNHAVLAPFRRATVTGLNCANIENDHHGSMVASRIVFGDIDTASVVVPTCRFLEVRVGAGPSGTIRAESVSGALVSAVVTAPDVRVFNLSFDGARGLNDLPTKQRAETLKQIEEIDNFAFDQDVLVVTAAGNVPAGVVPHPGYPLHGDDPSWALRSFPRSFNAITCGGCVPRLSAGGLATEVYAPSPFSRVGPGFALSPKPDFCASAGNTDVNYQPLVGAGILGFSALGEPREGFGTSFAAPLLAREAAFVFEELSRYTLGDSRPFACAVKAVLALTAHDVSAGLSPSLQPLAKRALGFGEASAANFRNSVQQRARFIWQGVIENEDDIVRVQLPIPKVWVDRASSPRLRLCTSWDTPVSSAAEKQWSCRDVKMRVRTGPDARAQNGSRGRIAGYPLSCRNWDLDKARQKEMVESDYWVLEFSYSQIAAYVAGHIVPPSQRIAFAAEIWDDSEEPLEPHSYVQSLPIAATLVRLSNTAAWLPQKITIASEL